MDVLRLLLSIVAAAGAVLGPSLGAGAPLSTVAWPWPLELPDRQITGTFLEARAGRFHTGLDLRTAGREGVVVRAPVSGRVVRIRASSHGYGLALYLRTEDGHTLVFAHLSRLSDRLRIRLESAQWASGRYTQDLSLRGEAVEVERGEVLALSGSTGVGAPHLHFEVRDPQERVTNPLVYFDLVDERAPRVEALRLVPLGPRARIQGRARRHTVDFDSSITVRGRVGVQVRVADFRPGNGFRLAPHRIELRLDGQVVYSIERTRLRFDQSAEMALQYEREDDGPAWVRLYSRPGLDLDSITAVDGGVLLAPPDTLWHELVVRAEDIDGNFDERQCRLRWDADPAQQMGEPSAAPWDLQSMAEEAGLVLVAFGPAGESPSGWAVRSADLQEPELDLNSWTRAGDGNWECLVPWDLLPASPWVVRDARSRTLLPPRYYLAGVELLRIPGSDLEWSAANPERFPGGSLRLELQTSPSRLEAAPGWQEVPGERWWIETRGWVHPEGLALRCLAPADSAESPHLGWVRIEPDGDLAWVGSLAASREDWGLRGVPMDPSHRVQVALLEDVAPPVLTPASLRLGERSSEDRAVAPGLTLSRWPPFVVQLEEDGSGVDPDGLEGWLDGESWPVRFDPEAKTLAFDFDRDPGPGAHRLRVVVRDRSGRTAEAQWRLDLTP